MPSKKSLKGEKKDEKENGDEEIITSERENSNEERQEEDPKGTARSSSAPGITPGAYHSGPSSEQTRAEVPAEARFGSNEESDQLDKETANGNGILDRKIEIADRSSSTPKRKEEKNIKAFVAPVSLNFAPKPTEDENYTAPKEAKIGQRDEEEAAGVDLPIVYGMEQDPASFLTAEVVDESEETERLRQAEAAGREQVLSQIVEANVEPIEVDTSEKQGPAKKYKWNKLTILLLVSIMVLVVIVVSAVLATRRRESSKSSASIEDGAASVPTAPPKSMSPSQSPTLLIPGCEGATLLSTTGDFIGGSLGDLQTGPTRCEDAIERTEALWYTVVGPPAKTSPTALTVSVCRSNERFVPGAILTFTIALSSGGCGSRTCIPTESLRREAGCVYTTWWAEEGREYHLAIGDYSTTSDGLSQNGPFFISAYVEQEPSNLVCRGARSVGTQPASVTEDFAESVRAVEDLPPSFADCDGSIVSKPTKWFSFVGRGMGVTALVCGDGNFTAQVQSTCDESERICKQVVTKEEGQCTAFSWNSDSRAPIDLVGISVEGSPTPLPKITVTFSLNDRCEFAQPLLNLPFQGTVNNDLAIPGFDTTAFACPILPRQESYRAAWYSWTADAEGCVSITSKPSLNSSIDPVVAVYNGSCSRDVPFTCVAMNGDIHGLDVSAATSFDPVAGEIYHFLLFGADVSSGEFELSINQTVNAECLTEPDVSKCTLCSDPVDDHAIPELSCAALADEASTQGTGSSFICSMYQTLGDSFCNCAPEIESNACGICPDGSQAPQPTKQVPGLNVTCGQLDSLQVMDSTTQCGFGMEGIARFCECPTVIDRSCSLCGEDDSQFNPELTIDFVTTCQDAETTIDRAVLTSSRDVECSQGVFERILGRTLPYGNIVGFCCRGEKLDLPF